jgi:regulator of sigma E protease
MMNETLLTWIIFLLAFGGMVIVHELGHFIAARLVKVEVEEFGIGFPTPGAITLFTWQGTRFTLNWLPLGGFVRPKGETTRTSKADLPPPPRGSACSCSPPVPS